MCFETLMISKAFYLPQRMLGGDFMRGSKSCDVGRTAGVTITSLKKSMFYQYSKSLAVVNDLNT